MAKKISSKAKTREALFEGTELYTDSLWLHKIMTRRLKAGRAYLLERYIDNAFIQLKVQLKKLPEGLLLKRLSERLPVLSTIQKRMGKRFNPVPMPIKD